MTAEPIFSRALDDQLELLDEIGRGGMGVVWRAVDLSSRREVAVKLLQSSSEVALERFEREALLTAAIDDFGIVKTLHTGTVRGLPAIVNELVEGAQPLDHAVQGRSLPERVALLGQVARAVGAAHARGIVHRDLKPGNILVDAQGRARVTDLGLALTGDLERLTRTGSVVGTPLFMAPEQILGQRDKIGPATDVWALGVILYLLLTDAQPFEAESYAELTRQIVSVRFDSPTKIAPETPADLETLCLAALQLDPEERPEDGAAFAAALERAVSSPEPARAGWIVLPLVGALLLVGGGVAAFSQRAPEPPTPVERPTAPPTVPEQPSSQAGLRLLPTGRDLRGAFAWQLVRRSRPESPISRFRSVLALRAEPEGDRLRLESRLTEVVFSAGPLTYDSRLEKNPELTRVVGAQILACRGRALLDPRTGEVLEVTGMLRRTKTSNLADPIQVAITRLANSFSNWGVRGFLERTFRVLPPDDETTRWRESRVIYPTHEFGFRTNLRSRLQARTILSVSGGDVRLAPLPAHSPPGVTIRPERLERTVTLRPDGTVEQTSIVADFRYEGEARRIETSFRIE